MKSELLEQLKQQLQFRKGELEKELSSFATPDPNIKGDWDSKYPRVPQGNLEEAANEVAEYSTRLHLEFSLETQLKDINSALEKIEKETYGVCENCQKPISEERLEASPEARTCVSCNT